MMIALYYCYTPYQLEVNKHISFQEQICENYDLKGRVRVSEEGINGVLSGTKEMLENYEKELHQQLLSGKDKIPPKDIIDPSSEPNDDFDFDVKYCHLRPDIPEKEQLFETLSVKQTREVVSLHEPIGNSSAPSLSDNKNGKGNPWRRRRRRRNKPKPDENKNEHDMNYTNFQTATHLKPEQWQQHLISSINSNDDCESSSNHHDKILIDARNIYESNVGYFQVPGIPTLLTNTRKYSSLPQILSSPEVRRELRGKDVYMYCTGGVRCERASQYLASLAADKELWVEDEGQNESEAKPPLNIYQLEGGIQRYLERFGDMDKTDKNILNKNAEISSLNPAMDCDVSINEIQTEKVSTLSETKCLFLGKNFVFDPRRTDPKVGPDAPGKCVVCSCSHNDYDNGHAPCEGKEARCCRCRVLVLVCDDCRRKVRCWGEGDEGTNEIDVDSKTELLPDVFCGDGGKECVNQGNNLDDIKIV